MDVGFCFRSQILPHKRKHYMFWQNSLCRNSLLRVCRFMRTGTILRFFCSSVCGSTQLCSPCFDFDLKPSSKNNLNFVLSKPLQHFSWAAAETICHSNSWNKMCQQDECLVHAHCNADQHWRGKKKNQFPECFKQEEIVVISFQYRWINVCILSDFILK